MSPDFVSPRELIVVAKREVELRVRRQDIVSAAGQMSPL
jgi:hypothetical protein